MPITGSIREYLESSVDRDDLRIGGPIDEAAIFRAEAALGLKFPDDYRRFVAEVGWAEIFNSYFFGVPLAEDDEEGSVVAMTLWIIIADRDGDAVIVDASTADGSVFGSSQMTSFPRADSLASFLIAVAQCMGIEREKYGYEVTDDDFNTIEPYLDDVKAVADEALGGENAKGLLRFFFG